MTTTQGAGPSDTATDAAPDFLLPSQAQRTGSTGALAPKGVSPEDPGYVPGVEYDQWRRYLLPVPGTDPSSLVPWTRVTTLSGALTSNEGLRVWTERKICEGIGLRRDLRALITATPHDKAVQDDVRAAAKVAAGAEEQREYGTAVHRGFEQLAGGQPVQTDLSEEYGRDLAAMQQCLAENGVEILRFEVLIVHETLRYAGRLDYFARVTLPDGRTVLRIIDTKTGKVAEKDKAQAFGCQLAGYANATHVYGPASRTFVPIREALPGLDATAGYILHVTGGVAQLHEIDLLTGWVDMLLAVKLLGRRKAGTQMLPVGRPAVVEDPAAVAAQWAPAQPGDAILPGDRLRPGVEPQSGDVMRAADAMRPVGEPQPDPASAVWQAPVERVEGAFFAAADEMFAAAGLVQVDGAPVLAVAAQESDPHLSVRPDGGVTQHVRPAVDNAPSLGVEAPAEQEDGEPERSASGRKRRACSKCRKPGHTAKKCPGVEGAPVEASEPAPAVCPHANGWTRRESDGWQVCADCGRPSEGFAAAMTNDEHLPVSAPEVPAAAPVPVPAQPGPAPAVAFVPPWQASAAPAPPTLLLDTLRAVTSQEEIGELWRANEAVWGEEHTELARQLIANGLPTLPPGGAS
jgi:hypothetical protein